MNRVRRLMIVFTLSAASAVAGWMGYEGFLNARFAQAKEQVEATREQLKGADDLATVFRSVGKVVEPSVVNIQVRKTVKGAHRLPMDPDLLRRFFPRDENGQPQVPEDFDQNGGDMEQVGTGSGVIMTVDGSTAFILTNNHVAGGAEDMLITLADGREIKNGKVVGTDPKSDLAVVKIQADRLIPAKWGNSDDLQKGDWIMAFGSPFGYVGSMTHGIVSALNRNNVGIIGSSLGYENFIQVDAPINPGNSGGPLVNLRGEVVGVNTAIASRSGGFQGIGFAIPSNQAKPIYDALREKGKVVRGWLGVEIVDVSKVPEDAKSLGYKGENGILVKGVLEKTPAYGKLQPGDVITQLNGKPVKDMQQLRNTIAATAPGTDVKMKVFRDNEERDVSITIAEQPEDTTALNNPHTNPHVAPDGATASALGLRLQTLNDDLSAKYDLGDAHGGAVITAVTPNSIAAKAGLKAGDLITKVDRTPVTTAKEAADALSKGSVARGIRLNVTNRDGSRFLFLRNAGKSEE